MVSPPSGQPHLTTSGPHGSDSLGISLRFYCLHNRGSGASMMAKAAISSNAQALYSLAVIQFNGSGGSKNDKDLRADVALCARAAFLGHIDALRELGHCLQDGYGVRQNITEGRRFLVQANARELAAVISSAAASGVPTRSCFTWNPHPHPQGHDDLSAHLELEINKGKEDASNY
ncbi:F-box protein At1g67340-like [Carya illinoinensis]|uniref:F-box protein At1g67340-like n=1 Tax=Carya illinoinensis TaxID=32201 RepID=UPI001C71EA90|nr:F-box protein At1g67340-like [Carya illinoinensis]